MRLCSGFGIQKRCGTGSVPCRVGIEDVLVPRLRVLELLVLAEQLSDVERDVVEELPVVDARTPRRAEVEELPVLAGDVVVVPPDPAR